MEFKFECMEAHTNKYIIFFSVLILICSLTGCKTNDEGVTYTLTVNEKEITENTVNVTVGDIVLSSREETSEDVAYKRITRAIGFRK